MPCGVLGRCLSLITQQQDAAEQTTRRHCIGVLYNLSFDYADVMIGSTSSQHQQASSSSSTGGDVANPIVNSLLELTHRLADPSDQRFCAITIMSVLREPPGLPAPPPI